MRQIDKMWFPEGYVSKRSEKALALANLLGRKKPGAKDAYGWEDPEYVILEAGVDDDMADTALAMGYFTRRTAAETAQLMNKPESYCREQMEKLAEYGVCFVNRVGGQDVYWTAESWIPGVMEMIVNNPRNIEKYPIVAYAMEAYGRVRGPKSAGVFPPGVGLMRVIPIETAIDGSTRRASYEEVSKYLNDNTVFSVSDCSCRTDREVMGEGCGHLKEDMCIQMGHAAEYYIRTKRGRAITREEAFAILKRAEENGLMHQIPNIDGSGKTHAICNCCGCSCLSLRTAAMYRNVDMVRSNYVSKVDKDKCAACGECVANCPVNAVRLGQKVCSSAPVVEDITTTRTPRDSEWGQADWFPGYRSERENVVSSGTSPCKTECPAHISIQGYIKLASQEKYREALAFIKKNNPFPAVCGRVCPHACEQACTRGALDEPVAIDDIKKFIAEQDLRAAHRFVPEKRRPYGKKIAVVGAGPSGLSCAYYLAVDGYEVTVFEREDRLGGMLTLGIPSFRLEKDVVDAEIDVLRELGVQFRTGVTVGEDVTLDELRAQGFAAFYLAVGAQDARKLNVPGEDAKGVRSGVEFLKQVNLGKNPALSGEVIVVGGGNVAIDVARTAARTGGKRVTMFCLESRAEMPALPEEVAEAEAEDVVVQNGWGPQEIITKNGKVTGVRFRRCVSVFDAEGRFRPVYDDAETVTVAADAVLVSIGQAARWGKLLDGSSAELNPNGTIQADPLTLQTAQPDVFAGGDAVLGPKFAIDAIAQGKEAAISLHRFVQPGQSLVYGRDRNRYKGLDTETALLEGYDRVKRQRAPEDAAKAKSFSDSRGVFDVEQLRRETERCLGCGAAFVDRYLCVGCGQCTTKCQFDAISLERVYDGEGVEFLRMKPVVVKQMLKRKVKITLKRLRGVKK